MILLSPIWLFLVVPLLASLWVWRIASRLVLALRIMGLVLILAALCDLAIRIPSQAGTVIVVADRSLSMPSGSEASQKEAIDLLQAAMGTDDRLGVIGFAQTATIEQAPQPGKFAGFVHELSRDSSNLTEAMESALALIPRDSPGRILLLTDGQWTGRNPTAVIPQAVARGVSIDYRPMRRSAANDVAIARLDAPATVAPGESFMITAWVLAPTAQEATFNLRRGALSVSSGKRQLVSGLNRFTFRDRALDPGAQSYSLTVTGTGIDPVPENNNARLLVGVQGPRPLLCVSPTSKSGLAALLQAGGLPVQRATAAECSWNLEDLAKFSAVVIENVPAQQIGGTAMESLKQWVQQTGAGLMVTGGKNMYGPGGYYRSPLEPILPVTMELRKEHRKLSVAMVIAMDRSGSMAMPVGGGRTKMDLANLGAAQVLELLGSMDEFGVIAVDTAPHTIADLAPITDKGRIRSDILRVQSMGGGIYIDEALAAAGAMIAKAKAGTKHIILFADAADSEQPGDYKEILAKCEKAGITVSVIGMGTRADSDAKLLEDIAARGKGRVFFTDKPDELPQLFAQDTFVVARNTFLDDATAVQATSGLTSLLGKSFDMSAPLGGYNLCYVRPEATLAALTQDEYHAPVVAAWQAGSGRVLCFTGEADGKYTGALAQWPQVGDFFTSLARWTAGQSSSLPNDMLITQDVQNGVHRVQLHLDPERKAEPFAGLPQVALLRGEAGKKPQSQQVAMHWTGADTLEVDYPLQGSETALATVAIPNQLPMSLAPVCLPYSPEYKPREDYLLDPSREHGELVFLDRLARATGGKERIELPGIWRDLPQRPRLVPVATWLLCLAVVVLLLEVLERRTSLLTQGFLSLWRANNVTAVMPARWFSRKPNIVTARPSQNVPAPRAQASPAAEPVPQPTTETPGAAKDDMLDALREARRQSKRRGEG